MTKKKVRLSVYRRFAMAAMLLQSRSTQQILDQLGDARVEVASLEGVVNAYNQVALMRRAGLVTTARDSNHLMVLKNQEVLALLGAFESEYHNALPTHDYHHYLMRESYKRMMRPQLVRFAAAEIMSRRFIASKVLGVLDAPKTVREVSLILGIADSCASCAFKHLRKAGLVLFTKGETHREMLYQKNEAMFQLLDDFDQRYNRVVSTED
jgi:hypothetical protein